MGRVRALVGLLLVGYGILILTKVLAHESPIAGFVSLALGLLVARSSVPPLPFLRARLVATTGAILVLLVVAYNLIRASTFSGPEWAIALYSAALLVAAPFLGHRLGRVEVATIAGWSFPLVLAPLGVFALNASLSTPQTGAAAAPLVAWSIVWPTVFALRATGSPAQLIDDTVVLDTQRGTLFLDIGLVCAGLYPMVLFGGILGLHAWRSGMGAGRITRLAIYGIGGLWLVNLLRLVVLAHIGVEWGPKALTDFHANLGWLLFGGFMLAFCLIFLRERVPRVGTPMLSASSSPGVLAPHAGTVGSWWRSVPKRP